MLCALVIGVIAWGAVAVVRPVRRPAPLAATWDVESAGAAAPVGPEEAWLGAPVAKVLLLCAAGAAVLLLGAPGAVPLLLGAPGTAPLLLGASGAAALLLGAARVGVCMDADAPAGGGLGAIARLLLRVPACTALDPLGKEKSSVLSKKSSVVGSWGEVDISAKGNTVSSKTTCREMMIRLE
jgi:hypothetical protein